MNYEMYNARMWVRSGYLHAVVRLRIIPIIAKYAHF
jgi:hypothetical protein